ncbi:hypothetical protein [Pectobacterium polaris]|uniref:hypothetical protein n=1 Tax=Pectobacterium polaris TaxID=2042057 RepID=UPI00158267C7|nr:hypothetical protein [Pectobacterium polaris]
MKKFQVRNVDDLLYQCIEQAAIRNERSIEGEVRFALRDYYLHATQPTEVTLSNRERWQLDTGRRLRWLFERLIADNYFREIGRTQMTSMPELVRLARHLNLSPGLLMDLIDGLHELTIPQAEQITSAFDASAEWLLSGCERPFPVESIGNYYHDFFIPPDGSKGYVFELVRIDGGRHDGTLFCLRYHPQTRRYTLGVVSAEFMLRAGMGATGHGKLKTFLLFLKTRCHSLPLNAFSWTTDEEEEDFWQVFGQHHPVFFQNPNRRTSARWLQQLLQGEDPGDWFTGWSPSLEEIANTEYGATSSE